MIKEITASGKDVAEAQANARELLGATELDDVKFEVIYLGRKGFMGFGAKPAQVRAYIEIPEKEEKKRKPERKKDRPERRPEHKENTEIKENKATKESTEATTLTESEVSNAQDAANKPKKKKNKKKPNPAQRETNEEQKPKSQVIPECELKFERRDVAEGEDMSYDFIRTVILDIGLDATAELYSCDDGTRRITIKGEDASTLIGHHGDTLDALQYLANLASARKNIHGERDKSRVTLDIEGYRAKREETLRNLARKMAAKALRNRRSVMLEPMSAYERRIIHSEIQNIEGISTNSIGSDSNRKIVIYLTDKKPKELFKEKEEETLADEAFVDDNSSAVDGVTLSDLADDSETEALEQTHSADDYVALDADSEIK